MQAKRIGQITGVVLANIFSPVFFLLQFIPGGSQKIHQLMASPKALMAQMDMIQAQVQQHPLEITFGFIGVVILIMVIDLAYIWLMAKLCSEIAVLCQRQLVVVKATALERIKF
jgi:hypothetical protein